MKRRLFKVRVESSAKDNLDAEDAFKQGRNHSEKTKELNLSDVAGTKVFEEPTVPVEDKVSIEKGDSTVEPVSTGGDAVTTASINMDAAGPSTTITEGVIHDDMMTMAEILVAIRNIRPRTTSVVIRDP
ncbi:hypothetical protein Tco_0463355, partial [Tanacetum coccineum]